MEKQATISEHGETQRAAGLWKTSFHHEDGGSTFLRSGGTQLYTGRIFVTPRMQKYALREGMSAGYHLYYAANWLSKKKKNSPCEATIVYLQYFSKQKVLCDMEKFRPIIKKKHISDVNSVVRKNSWQYRPRCSLLNKNKRTKSAYFLENAWFASNGNANSKKNGRHYEEPHAVREDPLHHLRVKLLNAKY